MLSDGDVTAVSRRLRDLIEPLTGQVYFSPEAHAAYEALGFAPSPGQTQGVALPDGCAYFTSRGSLLGQVPGEVAASAFAVFNPEVVVPLVALGWTRTDAKTIAAARAGGAVAQLRRILGSSPPGLATAVQLLQRAAGPLRPEGRPLFAGVLSQGGEDDGLALLWHLGDQLREYRGDSHTVAWVGAGFDATEIGLLTELYIGLPLRSYVRTRAWTPDQLDGAAERLVVRGLLNREGVGFTAEGREQREAVEVATDRQCRPAVEALGDRAEELFALLAPWSEAVVAASGYLRSARDLVR